MTAEVPYFARQLARVTAERDDSFELVVPGAGYEKRFNVLKKDLPPEVSTALSSQPDFRFYLVANLNAETDENLYLELRNS